MAHRRGEDPESSVEWRMGYSGGPAAQRHPGATERQTPVLGRPPMVVLGARGGSRARAGANTLALWFWGLITAALWIGLPAWGIIGHLD